LKEKEITSAAKRGYRRQRGGGKTVKNYSEVKEKQIPGTQGEERPERYENI